MLKKTQFTQHIILFALLFTASLSAEQLEVRHLNPPCLDEMHLGKRILCHRPMRRGSPKMKVEYIGDKVVAHNYGHGGSGWTLGPGSAQYVIDLFEKPEEKNGFAKNEPITIIGAGALGLFTAYCLLQRGYTNITIVAEQFDNLTSHNAGGLLAPVSMDNDPELQPIIDQIGIDAYLFYAAIAHKTHPTFSDGAIIVPTYFMQREDSGLEPYVNKVMQPAKDVILDFDNGTSRQMVVYDDGIFIDTAKMMAALTLYLQDKVSFVQQKIENFTEIKDTSIFNCTGLGSSRLNNDTQLVSVQGHLIMLKHQNPKDLDLMILVYFNEAKTKNGQKVKRSFYIFPKKFPETLDDEIGVIGGTFIEGATSNTPNDEEFDILIQGAKDFYGIKN